MLHGSLHFKATYAETRKLTAYGQPYSMRAADINSIIERGYSMPPSAALLRQLCSKQL